MDTMIRQGLVYHLICLQQAPDVCFLYQPFPVSGNFYVAFGLGQIWKHPAMGMVQLHQLRDCIYDIENNKQ